MHYSLPNFNFLFSDCRQYQKPITATTMPALDCKVYVGDLGSSANKADLEDSFSQYGRLTSVWVARNPPGFAFVEFEDNRDAEDAVRALDGR